MEATSEESLLKSIRPPRVEDAGLEDCALPPEAIKEAFFKAANSIKSKASSILSSHDTDDCIDDPDPSNGDLKDTLIGISPEKGSPGSCGAGEKWGLPEVYGDKVVDVSGVGEDSGDKILGEGVGSDGLGDCVDGLQGLEIGQDEGIVKDEKEEEEKEDQPVLAEAYF